MAKLSVKPGSESVSFLLFIQDSASTIGAGKTGLAYNTASLSCYYVRSGASAAASVSLITQTVTGAWSSGGFVEIDATNMPGVYRFDVPNAVLAAGVRSAVVMLKGASGMAPLVAEIDLASEVLDPVGVTTLLTRIVGTLDTGVHSPQSGDAFERLGSPHGIDLVADLDAMVGQINDLPTLAEFEARTLLAADYFDPANDDVTTVANVSNGVTVDAVSSSALNTIADAILKRDWTLVTGEASRSLLNALRFLRNKWSISGATLTVTKEDDTTTAWTATLSTDAAADPVTGSDPA